MRVANLIESKINKHRKGIKVFWWRPNHRGKRNFGDEITPIIIEKLWGSRCLWTRLADSDMVGAGSIIDLVATHNPKGHKVHVWGSGFIEEGPKLANDDLTFSLVRGPLSSARVPKGATVPCGDPGLLASKVFERADAVRYKVGIVPHMKDLDEEFVQKLAARDDCLIISPYQDPAKVASDITSCGIVFSSSLHGLIFADSFAVPNFRFKHTALEGGDYKFTDYYRSTNREGVSYTADSVIEIIESSQKLNELHTKYTPIADISKIQDIIIAAFPFNKEAPNRPE